MIRVSLLGLALLLAFSGSAGAQDDARTVTIPWGPVPGAIGYDFQISRRADLNPVDNQQSTTSNEVSLRLAPGVYYFRIRGKMRSGAPTAWSAAQSVTIQPKAPEQTYPSERFLFSKELASTGVPFRWKPFRNPRPYLLEVSDAGGRVVFRTTTGKSGADWVPDSSVGVGTYFWRVGFQVAAAGGAASKEEWGPKRSFDLSAKSLGLPDPSMNGGAEISLGTEYWIIARGAQALASYNVTDRDFGGTLTTTGLSGVYGLDFQWGPKPGVGRGLTGTLSGAVLTQLFSGTLAMSPRGSIKIGYRKSGSAIFGGPFVHAGFAITNALTMASSSSLTPNRIFRGQAGIGGELGFRLVPNFSLLLSGMLRGDLAGTSIGGGSTPSLTWNYEGRFGARWAFSRLIGLDFGVSAWMENVSWTAAVGTTSNSLSSYIVFDGGLGIRF